MLPVRIQRNSGRADKARRSPAHRAFVRSHACCGCGSQTAIECAHVRDGTDGGTGIKPSDCWTISLCRDCHARQHQIGEASFERERGINMKALAQEFVRHSPKRKFLEDMQRV